MGGHFTKSKKTKSPKNNQVIVPKNNQAIVPKNIQEEKLQSNNKEENKQNNLIINENPKEKKVFDFFDVIELIKKKKNEKFNWVDVDILHYEKKDKFGLFKIYNKKLSEHFVMRLYSFENIHTINEETKQEILKLYQFYEEIENLSCNFICKLNKIDIQEQYIIFINENGILTMNDYILESKKIKIEDLHYYITTMLFNLIDIIDKINENSIFSQIILKIVLYENKSKISFEYNEKIDDVNNNDKILLFFKKLHETIQNNTYISQNKDFQQFNKIIADVVEKKQNNAREIVDLFLSLNIDSNKPLLNKEMINPTDEKKIEAYLNSAKLFESLNLIEQAKEY